MALPSLHHFVEFLLFVGVPSARLAGHEPGLGFGPGPRSQSRFAPLPCPVFIDPLHDVDIELRWSGIVLAGVPPAPLCSSFPLQSLSLTLSREGRRGKEPDRSLVRFSGIFSPELCVRMREPLGTGVALVLLVLLVASCFLLEEFLPLPLFERERRLVAFTALRVTRLVVPVVQRALGITLVVFLRTLGSTASPDLVFRSGAHVSPVAEAAADSHISRLFLCR